MDTGVTAVTTGMDEKAGWIQQGVAADTTGVNVKFIDTVGNGCSHYRCG